MEIKIEQEGVAQTSFSIDDRLGANTTPQLKEFWGRLFDKETRTYHT